MRRTLLSTVQVLLERRLNHNRGKRSTSSFLESLPCQSSLWLLDLSPNTQRFRTETMNASKHLHREKVFRVHFKVVTTSRFRYWPFDERWPSSKKEKDQKFISHRLPTSSFHWCHRWSKRGKGFRRNSTQWRGRAGSRGGPVTQKKLLIPLSLSIDGPESASSSSRPLVSVSTWDPASLLSSRQSGIRGQGRGEVSRCLSGLWVFGISDERLR